MKRDVCDAKAAIRSRMRELRRLVPADRKKAAETSICENLFRRISAAGPRIIAIYLATPEELSLDELVRRLAELPEPPALVSPRWNGKEYVLAPLRLEGGAIDPASLRRGPMNVRESVLNGGMAPEKVDFWVVPGLAFTLDGGRLGYGGGWYDRLLAAANPDAKIFAPALPFQILPDLPREEHDLCIDSPVTENML